MKIPGNITAIEASYPKTRHPGWFKPAFTPAEMLSLGIFGRHYFAKATLEDLKGLPEDVFAQVEGNMYDPPRWGLNYFQVQAGENHDFWVKKGLIFPEDPLGWYHWYCRYYAGRRHERDLHQIARWQNFKRWLSQGQDQWRLRRSVSPVICQSLLQWGYNPADCYTEGEVNNLRPPIPRNERTD